MTSPSLPPLPSNQPSPVSETDYALSNPQEAPPLESDPRAQATQGEGIEPDVAPEDFIDADVNANYDLESDIYSPKRSDDGAYQAGIEYEALPLDDPRAIQQIEKGVVGGALDAYNSVSNLIDQYGTPTLRSAVSTITGIDEDTLEKSSPWFQVQNRETPKDLQPSNPGESIVNGISQWYSLGPLTKGLGALAKGTNILRGTKVTQLGQFVESNVPKLSQLARETGNLITRGSGDLTKAIIGFDAHEGNWTDALREMTENSPWADDLNKYLSPFNTNEGDDELLARVKNGMVSTFAEPLAVAGWTLAKIAKHVGNFKALVKEGKLVGEAAKAAKKELEAIAHLSDNLEAEIAKIKEQDPHTLMDYLVGKQEPKTIYRGHVEGRSNNTSSPTFWSDNKEVAKAYAGEGGSVLEGKADFNNLFEAKDWMDAKTKLGLPTSTTMPDLIAKIQAKGYDGAKWKGAHGDEYVRFPEGSVRTEVSPSGNKEAGTGAGNLDGNQAPASSVGSGEESQSTQSSGSPNVAEARIEILPDNTNVHEAVGKYYQDYRMNTPEGRQAASRKALRQVVNASKRMSRFRAEKFVASINEKLRHGEKIDIYSEVMDHMNDVDLTNIDEFATRYKEVVKATTKAIKTYTSNEEYKKTVIETLAQDLGDLNLTDAHTDALEHLVERGIAGTAAVDEAALEMGALQMQKVVLPKLMATKAFLLDEANKVGDAGLASMIRLELNELNRSYQKIRSTDEVLGSAFGRGLKARQTKWTDEDALQFTKNYKQARQGLNLLEDTSRDLTDQELDLLATASGDIHEQGHGNNVGYMFGKFFGAMDQAHKLGTYTMGAISEILYSNILSGPNTLKNIAWGTGALNVVENATSITGGAILKIGTGNGEPLNQALDEVRAFTNYIPDALSAGMRVLRFGEKNGLDYTPVTRTVISRSGLREHFGASVGDKLEGTMFQGVGEMSDRVIDFVGSAYRIIPTRVLGGLDTAFMVAKQKALADTALAAEARGMGLTGLAKQQFINDRLPDLLNDLTKGRHAGWTSRSWQPKSSYSRDSLKALSQTLIDQTDTIKLAAPMGQGSMKEGEKAISKGDIPRLSDRQIFRVGQAADRLLDATGTKTALAPFTKTFFNGLQWGADMIPVTNLMSPINRKILTGDIGDSSDQAKVLGKLFVGSAMSLTGFGLAASGLMGAPSGSKDASFNQQQLTGMNSMSFNMPMGSKSVSIDLSRFEPVVSPVMVPGKLFQLSMAAADGTMDPGSAGYAAIALGMEAFGSGRYLQNSQKLLNGLAEPSNNTGASLAQNFGLGNLGTLAVPASVNYLRAFTDPSSRDPKTPVEAVMARVPGFSGMVKPRYDMFGNTRPNRDYFGETETWYLNPIKALTPLGVTEHAEDALVSEMEKFGKLGQSLTPPQKAVSYKGMQVPLDAFTNDKGESLWDLYNKQFNAITYPSASGSGKMNSIRDTMNELIQSDDYKKGLGDTFVKWIAGKRTLVPGGKFAELADIYNGAKRSVINGESGSLWGEASEYRDAQGRTVEDHYNDLLKQQESNVQQ